MFAIVLAAGAGTRMGGPKALTRDRGRTFLDAVLATVRQVEDLGIVVVLAENAGAVLEAHDLSEVRVILNPAPGPGPISSIRVALAESDMARARAILVHPVDHPRVQADTLKTLVRTFAQEGSPIVVPTFQGRGGHPTLFGRSVYAELLSPDADHGARAVVRRDPSRVTRIEVPDPGILANLNRPNDLAG